MNRTLKSIAITMLMMVFALGCNKPEDPNHEGDNDLPVQPIVGLFSINDSTQVCFSPGNLQYRASTDTWRFAENQWDYIGEANTNISETYDGWIDLFSWGRGDNPTYVSTNSYDTVFYTFVDWGVNPISNWDGDECQWRALDYLEWYHLLYRRTTDSGIRFALATVNDVKGFVLLPDQWDEAVFTFVGFNNTGHGYEKNTITKAQWELLERYGVIFLPAAGVRNDTSVIWVQENGLYWIAGPSHPFGYVYYVQCSEGDVEMPNYCPRRAGLSVRLVRDAE